MSDYHEWAKFETQVHRLPRYRHYRDFIFDRSEGRYVGYEEAQEVKKLDERSLIDLLENLESLFPESFALFFESFMSSARVVEKRLYRGCTPEIVIKYAGEAVERPNDDSKPVCLMVAYDRHCSVNAWTFPPDDPEPMRFRSLGREITSRPEVVLDRFCDEYDCRVSIESVNGGLQLDIAPEYDEEGPEPTTFVEFTPYGFRSFSHLIRIEDPARKLAKEILLTYMREGSDAALALSSDWSALGVAHDEGFEMRETLMACKMRILRKSGGAWDATRHVLEDCKFPSFGGRSYPENCTFCGKNRENMLDIVYWKTMAERAEHGFDERVRLKLQYLAMFKHAGARRQLTEDCKCTIPEDFGLDVFWSEASRRYKDESKEEEDDVPF